MDEKVTSGETSARSVKERNGDKRLNESDALVDLGRKSEGSFWLILPLDGYLLWNSRSPVNGWGNTAKNMKGGRGGCSFRASEPTVVEVVGYRHQRDRVSKTVSRFVLSHSASSSQPHISFRGSVTRKI